MARRGVACSRPSSLKSILPGARDSSKRILRTSISETLRNIKENLRVYRAELPIVARVGEIKCCHFSRSRRLQVGRTPWSAADPPVGLSRIAWADRAGRRAPPGDPRGPGGPPYSLGAQFLFLGKNRVCSTCACARIVNTECTPADLPACCSV